MDRYLFRGKTFPAKNWIIGSLNKEGKYREIKDTNGIFVVVIYDTVGQCTGLRDVHDKLIFEGDIVRYRYDADHTFDLQDNEWDYGVVVWQGEKYEYPAFDLDKHNFHSNGLSYILGSDVYEIEIAGNVYDNPELLEVLKMPKKKK